MGRGGTISRSRAGGTSLRGCMLAAHGQAAARLLKSPAGPTNPLRSKGDNRAVTVYKRPQRQREDTAFELPLGPASLAALDAHFQARPPAGEASAPAHDPSAQAQLLWAS